MGCGCSKRPNPKVTALSAPITQPKTSQETESSLPSTSTRALTECGSCGKTAWIIGSQFFCRHCGTKYSI